MTGEIPPAPNPEQNETAAEFNRRLRERLSGVLLQATPLANGETQARLQSNGNAIEVSDYFWYDLPGGSLSHSEFERRRTELASGYTVLSIKYVIDPHGTAPEPWEDGRRTQFLLLRPSTLQRENPNAPGGVETSMLSELVDPSPKALKPGFQPTDLATTEWILWNSDIGLVADPQSEPLVQDILAVLPPEETE